jgi:hypothetical protein
VFHPDPEIPQLKQLGLDVNPSSHSVLPEIPQIEVVVALEIVDLHPAGNDSLKVVHNRREVPDKGCMAADPEIEDVPHEEQVGRPNPGPHVLEKAEQKLCVGLIQPFQVDV